MGMILVKFASIWIVCGMALFLFFLLVMRSAERRAEDDHSVIPLLNAIYTYIDNVGWTGFLACCLLLWPVAVNSMLRRSFGRKK